MELKRMASMLLAFPQILNILLREDIYKHYSKIINQAKSFKT